MPRVLEVVTSVVARKASSSTMTIEELSDLFKSTFNTIVHSHKELERHILLNRPPVIENIEESILEDTIICLICGKAYATLNNHLKVHGTNTKDYKVRYGFPLSQGLSCKKMTRRRRKVSKELGLDSYLAGHRRGRSKD